MHVTQKGKSGKWYEAKGIVDADPHHLLVTGSEMQEDAEAIAYGLSAWPLTSVFNTAGLPASPFSAVVTH